MKERPILFSAPMVRAVLAGTKTQTRRVITQAVGPVERFVKDMIGVAPNALWWWTDFSGRSEPIRCPFGIPGDRLWVRETFGPLPEYPDAIAMPEYDGGHDPDRLIYRADEPLNRVSHYAIDWSQIRWTPSIHMPRWASRITLEITDVRVQRLQDISEEDARSEGVEGGEHPKRHPDDVTSVDVFAALWDSINGTRATWSANPWVWAISFKRVTP